MEKPEFKIGDIVTIDRYNRKGDESKAEIIGYGQMPISRTLTYKVVINGCEIQTTGGSIMESKKYEPVPDNERHGYVDREKERLEDEAWLKRTKMK